MNLPPPMLNGRNITELGDYELTVFTQGLAEAARVSVLTGAPQENQDAWLCNWACAEHERLTRGLPPEQLFDVVC